VPWIKLDDHFADHPKIVEVGTIGLAVQIRALCYCARYLTDGFLTESVGSLLTNPPDLPHQDLLSDPDPRPLVEKMMASGLWDKVKKGYMVHDYLKYNPSRKQVLESRERDLMRKKSSKGNPGGVQAESRSPVPVPHVEVQSVTTTSPVVVVDGRKLLATRDEGFDRFWLAYPKKEAKAEAKKSWAKIKPSATLVEAMLTAIERQKQTRKWLEGIIPMPVTWLNQKRWEDEVLTVSEAPAPKSAKTVALRSEILKFVQDGERRDRGALEAPKW
jgi:hypothetical protein